MVGKIRRIGLTAAAVTATIVGTMAFASLASANDGIKDGAPEIDFVNRGAPQWNFAEPTIARKKQLTCWPSDAWPNGTQHTGNSEKVWPNAGSGCAAAGSKFPTYYNTAKCGSELRVAYFLYFPHDGFNGGGHRHDWENIAVVWKKDGNMWHRDSLKLSAHGGYKTVSWANAESWSADKGSAGKGKEFPRVFVGWGKHAMHNDQGGLTDVASNNVGPNYDHEYRSAAHSVWSSDGLVNASINTDIGKKINGATWGDATGTPTHANICG